MRLLGLGAGVLLFAIAATTQTDPDLWGHTRFGIDILASRDLPSIDPYSFTQDRPWINHEWLSELQMGAAYVAAGSTGLALLKGALTGAALLLIWSALKGVDFAPRFIIFALTIMSSVPVTRTLRPQAWSLLFLTILCKVLIEQRDRARWWLPLLFALWANLHGGWIVGFGVLAAWTVCELLMSRRLAVLVVAILSLAATLVTPYGWRLWSFLLETVRLGRDIGEWRPLFSHPPMESVPWLVTIATAAWLLRRPHPLRLPVAAVIAMLAFSSFRVMRIAPLFIACAVMLLSPWFRQRFPVRTAAPAGAPGLPTVAPAGAKVGDQRLVAAGLGAAAIAAAVYVGTGSLSCIRTEGAWIPDRDAARILAGAAPGRLVTFFDWGEYALWHFGPRLRVSMDGRRETVYSERRLLEHDAIVRGDVGAFATLASWNAEYVWLPSRSRATRAWLLAHGYRLDRETARSFVAVRGDLPVLTLPEPGPTLGSRCFPD